MSLSDILIKLKMEFNAISSGNWEGINFNRRSFQMSMYYRTFGPIYILKSSVLLAFLSVLTDGPTVFGKSGLATGQWFSLGTPVSSTNKTDRHNIAEILLKVVINTIKQTKRNPYLYSKKTVKSYGFAATRSHWYKCIYAKGFDVRFFYASQRVTGLRSNYSVV